MIRPAPTPINRVPVIGPLTYGEQMGLAPRTLAAYRSDWADFVRWCAARGLEPLPAAGEAMAAYVDDRAATLRVGTLQRRLAAIRAVHLAAGLAVPSDAPGVTAAMTRARWRQRHVVAATNPITVEELRAMSRALPVTTIGVRDRAAILLGFGAALRPGELVGLAAADVTVGPAGLRVRTSRGSLLVPYGSAPELCAVAAWTRWVEVAGLTDGPALRPVDRRGVIGAAALGEKAVGRIVRRAAVAAGLDEARFRGLSLRRGMVDAAAAHGSSRRAIMRQTGHRSERLVRAYLDLSA